MFQRIASHYDEMALAITLWMCTLPLISLFVLTFFGQKVSLLIAAGSLISILAICWGICSWKILKS